jgi:hypothetical protein
MALPIDVQPQWFVGRPRHVFPARRLARSLLVLVVGYGVPGCADQPACQPVTGMVFSLPAEYAGVDCQVSLIGSASTAIYMFPAAPVVNDGGVTGSCAGDSFNKVCCAAIQGPPVNCSRDKDGVQVGSQMSVDPAADPPLKMFLGSSSYTGTLTCAGVVVVTNSGHFVCDAQN